MDVTDIEVLGVPDDLLEADRMVDKLMIHFLRPRNGGGEVRSVKFPTSHSGRAVVVFEEPEVATNVLQRSHVLMVDEQPFPLVVRRMDRPEFDMPVKATVDVTMFNSVEEVLRLLNSSGFQVKKHCPGQLLVVGSFLKLRAVKAQLQQLLTRDPQPHSSTHTPRDPQPHSSTHTPRVNDRVSGASGYASGASGYASGASGYASGASGYASGASGYASGASGYASGASGYASETRMQPANQTLSASHSSVNGEQLPPHHQTSRHTAVLDSGFTHGLSSPQRRDPSTGLQAAGPGANGTLGRTLSLGSDNNDSYTLSRKKVSFLTEVDVLDYALCFRKKDINGILQSHNTAIDVKCVDNSDVRSVVLDGRNPETAMVKLQSILSYLTTTLRTQEIKLPSLERDIQTMVSMRIQKYKDIYPAVLVRQVGDILRLVGPSSDSYEMKQRLLGNATELPPTGRPGRPTGRNCRDRRSRSVPRLTNRNDAQSDHVKNPAPTQYSPPHYSPPHYSSPHYQDDTGPRAEPRPGEPPPPASSSRGRSSSESQAKANDRKEELRQGRGTRETRGPPRQDEAVPAGGQRSAPGKIFQKIPSLNVQKNMTKTEMKQKMFKKTKI